MKVGVREDSRVSGGSCGQSTWVALRYTRVDHVKIHQRSKHCDSTSSSIRDADDTDPERSRSYLSGSVSLASQIHELIECQPFEISARVYAEDSRPRVELGLRPWRLALARNCEITAFLRY